MPLVCRVLLDVGLLSLLFRIVHALLAMRNPASLNLFLSPVPLGL